MGALSIEQQGGREAVAAAFEDAHRQPVAARADLQPQRRRRGCRRPPGIAEDGAEGAAFLGGELQPAQGAIVEAGMRTTATMVIGFDETLDERMEHLDRTRAFQDATGGLFSFLCWTYKPYGTAFGGRDGFRISFAADEAQLAEALRRIAAAVAA